MYLKSNFGWRNHDSEKTIHFTNIFWVRQIIQVYMFYWQAEINICLDYFTVTSCLSYILNFFTLSCVFYFLPQPDYDCLVEKGVCLLGSFCIHSRTYLTGTYFVCCCCLSSCCCVIIIKWAQFEFKFHSLHLADLHLRGWGLILKE